MNSEDIKKQLNSCFNNYDYKLYNSYVFDSESDFFCVSKSGYVTEVEIKISRSDFKNDFKKVFCNGMNKHEYLKSKGTYKPNKFYFAVPEGMIKKEEVPEYAGLIYINSEKTKYGVFYRHTIVKDAKFLHKENLFKNHKFVTTLMNKFYWQTMALKRNCEIVDTEINYGFKRIDFKYYQC